MKAENPQNTRFALRAGLIPGAFMALLLLTMCHSHSERVEIHRLDTHLVSGEMPDDEVLLNAASRLFEAYGLGDYDRFAASEFAHKESVTAHVDKVAETFSGGLGKEENLLGRAFAVLGKELPDFTAPEVYSVISPYSQSVIVADTIIFVGLNHYLGADYEPYRYFPDYLAALKTRKRMPVDVVEALVRTKYHREWPHETTTLDRMIYYGAVTETVMRALGLNEQEAIGLTDTDMKWFKENDMPFWTELLERRLLYSTDLSVARSLLEPAPYTTIIGSGVPARVGRLTAHRLVKSYLKAHPEVTVADMLAGKVAGDADFLTDAKPW